MFASGSKDSMILVWNSTLEEQDVKGPSSRGTFNARSTAAPPHATPHKDSKPILSYSPGALNSSTMYAVPADLLPPKEVTMPVPPPYQQPPGPAKEPKPQPHQPPPQKRSNTLPEPVAQARGSDAEQTAYLTKLVEHLMNENMAFAHKIERLEAQNERISNMNVQFFDAMTMMENRLTRAENLLEQQDKAQERKVRTLLEEEKAEVAEVEAKIDALLGDSVKATMQSFASEHINGAGAETEAGNGNQVQVPDPLATAERRARWMEAQMQAAKAGETGGDSN